MKQKNILHYKNSFISKVAACVALSALFLLSSCSQKKAEDPRAEMIFDTLCAVNAYEDGTKNLYDEIFARLKEIESRFNVNSGTSDISIVNAAAGKNPVKVHDDVFYVLEYAVFIAQKTDGAFDPTVQPLVNLWGINTEHAKVPSADEIRAAMEFVDWSKVLLDKDVKTVFLQNEGMALNLGAIVKGFATDEVCLILQNHKVKRAIIDFGGNIFVFGSKKDKSPWKVGVKDPVARLAGANGADNPIVVLSMSKPGSVVTSGIYERFFRQNGVIYHHIMDTRTGCPSQNGCLSSTIISSCSMEADVMSTVSFVLGYDKFAELFPDVKCIFIMDKGAQEESTGGHDGGYEIIASKSLEGVIESRTDIVYKGISESK